MPVNKVLFLVYGVDGRQVLACGEDDIAVVVKECYAGAFLRVREGLHEHSAQDVVADIDGKESEGFSVLPVNGYVVDDCLAVDG